MNKRVFAQSISLIVMSGLLTSTGPVLLRFAESAAK